jgi:hypothetical protein
MTSRTVLAACRVIAAASYAAALFTPTSFLPVSEFPLLVLFAVVLIAPAVRHRRGRRPAPSCCPVSRMSRSCPSYRQTTKGTTCEH